MRTDTNAVMNGDAVRGMLRDRTHDGDFHQWHTPPPPQTHEEQFNEVIRDLAARLPAGADTQRAALRKLTDKQRLVEQDRVALLALPDLIAANGNDFTGVDVIESSLAAMNSYRQTCAFIRARRLIETGRMAPLESKIQSQVIDRQTWELVDPQAAFKNTAQWLSEQCCGDATVNLLEPKLIANPLYMPPTTAHYESPADMEADREHYDQQAAEALERHLLVQSVRIFQESVLAPLLGTLEDDQLQPLYEQALKQRKPNLVQRARLRNLEGPKRPFSEQERAEIATQILTVGSDTKAITRTYLNRIDAALS